ncbi:MAG TPA: NADH:ubiquinone reductase (Na(+)-transporting) subunit E [Planctomycetes bacterium]|jgi:Na+-transporting NADH:ubiquinone oxidoreductase subunit E|nr:NADH:ubiquinone reductase (Na(+)-transporting) subunit E [Planctomycetota bacterium]
MPDVSPFVILFAAVFTNNILLVYFLGMCSFIAVSNTVPTALGLGAAVTFVSVLTAAAGWPVYHLVLVPLGLEYLQFIVFIVLIAALVQFVEMVIERTSQTLYVNLGIFLPLITVNCAILGLCLFMVSWSYGFLQSLAWGAGSGIGWFVAVVALAGLRQKIRFSKVPPALEGAGITIVVAGTMAMAFMGFAGMVAIR